MEHISPPLTPHFSAEISTINTPALVETGLKPVSTTWYSERYWANYTSGLKPMIISPLNPMLKHGVKTGVIFQKSKVLPFFYTRSFILWLYQERLEKNRRKNYAGILQLQAALFMNCKKNGDICRLYWQ